MSFSASNNFIIVVTVVVPRVCVCLFVVFFGRHVNLDPDVRTCVHRGTENSFIYYIIIVIFAENASFKSYGVICLPRMPLISYSGAAKYGYQRNPHNVGMTLLFAVLTKNDSFRSYSTFVYLLRAHILHINTCT